MLLDTLYKRTKTGAIQYWKIEVKPGDGCTLIEKESGQLGTKNPTMRLDRVDKGKNIGRANETSHREQAELEARSDWKKKQDEGYKSLKDLGFHTLVEGDGSVIKEHLEKYLPEFNTDASGNVKPMLATDYTKVKATPFPALAEPKFDGVRSLTICKLNNNVGEITILSRKGKSYTVLQHIETAILEFFDGLEDNTMFILDGEVYAEGLTFQEITSAVKKTNKHTPLLKLRVYDLVSDLPQHARKEELRELVGAIGSEHIQYVAPTMVSNMQEVKALHDDWVQQGYEGAMIRLLNGKYGQGQRSRELLKVKEFDENEFEIIGGKVEKVPMATGDGATYDPDQIQLVDSFTYTCRTKGGGVFDPKAQGTRKQRAEIMNNLHKLIGKQLTVKHFGWTDDGLPRFPIGKGVRDYE